MQSRLAQAAHERELQVARKERHLDAKLGKMRDLLAKILGPMQSLLQEAENSLLCYSMSVAGIDDLMGFYVTFAGSKEKMFKFVKGDIMTMVEHPFLLEKLVQKIKTDPEGTIAKDYRGVMKVALREYFLPTARLIGNHLNELPFPSRDNFKEKFPEIASNPQLRKILLLQLSNWIHMMQHIVETEWENGDYSNIFPKHVKYPLKAMGYLIWMVDSVKDKIKLMTADVETFTNVSAEEEMAEIQANMEKKAAKKLEVQGDRVEEKTTSLSNKTKYAIGAVTGAAGSTVAAVVIGK